MSALPQADGGCASYGNAIVCSGRGFTFREIAQCPTCDRRRRFVVRWEMWYGETSTCTHCGDGWQDGELMPRPFQRAWRRKSAEGAQNSWTTAMPRAQFLKARRAYLDAYFTDEDEALVEDVVDSL